MKTTTLRKIEKCRPSKDMWDSLLEGLGKTESDDEPLPYARILEIFGLDYALWATRTETDFRWVQELAVAYALRVNHLMRDPRSMSALEAADLYLRGKKNKGNLYAQVDGAQEAYKDAVNELYKKYLFERIENWDAKPDFTHTSKAAAALYATRSVLSENASDSSDYAIFSSYSSCINFPPQGPELEWQEQEFLRVVG